MTKSRKTIRRDREQMFSLVELYNESGLSRAQFCQEMDIAPHTFQYWYKKYKNEQNPESMASSSGFVKLDITDRPSVDCSRMISIIYPGGTRVELPIL